MTDLETLAVAQALYKAMAAAVSTKDPDSLRGRMDEAAVRSYEATGAKSFDLRLNGLKVGTYGVRVSRPVRRTDLAVRDRDAFETWCLAGGVATRETWQVDEGAALSPELREDFGRLVAAGAIRRRVEVAVPEAALADARRRMEATGELPDGCEAVAVDEPSRPIGTTLRVDESLVAAALGDALPAAVAGLLPGGGEGA